MTQARESVKVRNIFPYFVLPLGFLCYEILTIMVMSSYSRHSIGVSLLNPQNAFISLFWFDGYSNVISLIAFVVGFDMVIFTIPSQVGKYFVAFFALISSFYIAYYVNTLWLRQQTYYNYTYGQSGVVYALWGLFVGVLVILVIYFVIKHEFIYASFFIMIPFMFLYLLSEDYSLFFNVSTNVNYFVHEHAFGYGIIAGIFISVFSLFVSVLVPSYNYYGIQGGIR